MSDISIAPKRPEVKEYPRVLRFSDLEDIELNRRAIKYARVITMFDNSDPQIVTHEEFRQMVKEELVAPDSEYWTVTEGKIGVVTLNIGSARQWEMVSNAKSDYLQGWRDCMRHHGVEQLLSSLSKKGY